MFHRLARALQLRESKVGIADVATEIAAEKEAAPAAALPSATGVTFPSAVAAAMPTTTTGFGGVLLPSNAVHINTLQVKRKAPATAPAPSAAPEAVTTAGVITAAAAGDDSDVLEPSSKRQKEEN